MVLAGVTGALVRVEVDVADGLPSVGVVGLARHLGQRVALASRGPPLDSVGLKWPNRRITISLSPAEVRKQGAAIPTSPSRSEVLAASEQVPVDVLRGTAFIGELGLDGRIRGHPRGCWPVRSPPALPGSIAWSSRRTVPPSSTGSPACAW